MRDNLTVKACNVCGVEKPLSDFYSRANRRPNRTTERTYSFRCKDCDRAASRAAHARYANAADTRILPESQPCSRCGEVKAASEFALNRSKRSGLQSVCYTCHRDRRYGLAPGQFDAMLADQRGLCAICEKPCSRGYELSVDHDHVTGRVRGLLCQNCNAALGMLKDDPALLARAIEYLKRGVDSG